MCTDCDQNLIRIGSNLYTLHNAVTCTKKESKPICTILNQNHIGTINQNHDGGDVNFAVITANQVCDQEICIKKESEELNEKSSCVITTIFHQTINADSGESFSNQKNIENASVSDALPIDTDSAQQIEIKIEPEAMVAKQQSSSPMHQSVPETISLPHKPLDKHETRDKQLKHKTNNKYERIPCKICGKIFNVGWMNKHMRAYHSINNEIVFDLYQCDICKRFIGKKKSLISHMKLKHDRKRKEVKCKHCNRTFSCRRTLEYHQVRNVCSSQNNSSNDSQANEKTSPEKPYMCEICGAKYVQPEAVKTHQYRKHKIGGHPCDRCKQLFHTARGLINHGLSCEKLLQRTFECFLCHRVCPSKENLVYHLRTKHVSSEKKKKQFICEECNRCFSSSHALQSHKARIHMNLDIRNSVCTTCGRAFSHHTKLQEHMRIHTGEKPFQCSYDGCSKTFRFRSGIASHIKHTHQRQKPFRCRIDGCHEEFGGPAGYKKHKLNVHGIPIPKK